MQRALRVLAPDARYSLLSDGAVVPAFGVLGGLSGAPVGAWIDRNGDIEGFATPGKIAGYPLKEGDVVLVRSAGGGGYGDPLDRDPERVAADLSDAYISPTVAHNLYGLVLDERQRVDAAATRARRQSLRASRVHLVALLTPDAFEKGAVSRRRVWRLNPADAALAAIGEDEVAELDSGRAAPLRGWARLEASVRPGTVGIDARGLAILKAAAGERISLRRVLTGTPSRPAMTGNSQ